MESFGLLPLGHGIFYLTTGLWPLISMRTFLKVTGPKTDLWLVNTVGAIVAAVGAGLLVAWARDEVTLPLVVVAMGAAAGLAAIDLVYVSRRVIPPVYLLDALAEAILIGWWILALI